ncbi:hypothetical protein TNIN_109151 [Trichonephila inaurata madagascariensis]|uniref:Uncharacterized protein n=1 Tax=Trichonephila inaurata madagascariensis TaxID=2747483 RepID=A0A8X6INV0_9ARAC|nr:hypothetical protein TNIN_109151 [Trichonephila inaurata madagascariensis]
MLTELTKQTSPRSKPQSIRKPFRDQTHSTSELRKDSNTGKTLFYFLEKGRGKMKEAKKSNTRNQYAVKPRREPRMFSKNGKEGEKKFQNQYRSGKTERNFHLPKTLIKNRLFLIPNPSKGVYASNLISA